MENVNAYLVQVDIDEAEETIRKGYNRLRELGIVKIKKAVPEENGPKEI